MAFGAALGAPTGKVSTYCIHRRFVNRVSEKVTEDTSALFLMPSRSVVDRVSGAARQKGWNSEIISTHGVFTCEATTTNIGWGGQLWGQTKYA
jgi:uncharacterized membrane protein